MGGEVPFDQGVVAASEIHAEATGPIPGKLAFTLVLEDGGYVVKSLSREPGMGGLTGELLRQIPLATLVRMAIEKARPVTAPPVVALSGHGASASAGRGRLDLKPPKMPAGREGPSDDLLRFVGFAYRYAVLIGEPPIEFVIEKLKGPSRATVARWINLAGERGLWSYEEE
jgi:hypothetical protein